jgi:hypothetical protein
VCLRRASPDRRYRERVTALTRPRGPLPRRVYWTRRLLVLAVALLLVVGISRLLHTGGPGDAQQTAATVGGTPTASDDTTATGTPSQTTDSTTTGAAAEQRGQQAGKKRKKEPLPQPSGPCDPADLVVTPVVRKAHAGDPIRVVLEVSTHESPACTWQVSPDDVFVTISDDDATIWSSQQCPGVLPDEEIVPRQEKVARTSFFWNGKASDASCSAATDWAVIGSYRIDAVARGSVEPQESTFVIGSPTRATVTRTPKPTPTPSTKPSTRPSTRPSSKPSSQPSSKPERGQGSKQDRQQSGH